MRLSLTKAQAEKVSKEFEKSPKADALEMIAEKVLVVARKVKSETTTAVVKVDSDPEALRLANLLRDYVVAIAPYQRDTNAENWAKDIRLLHEKDGVDYRAIEVVMRYMFEMYQPTSKFDWRRNIRSGLKFRKHWEYLFEEAKQAYESSQIETV